MVDGDSHGISGHFCLSSSHFHQCPTPHVVVDCTSKCSHEHQRKVQGQRQASKKLFIPTSIFHYHSRGESSFAVSNRSFARVSFRHVDTVGNIRETEQINAHRSRKVCRTRRRFSNKKSLFGQLLPVSFAYNNKLV